MKPEVKNLYKTDFLISKKREAAFWNVVVAMEAVRPDGRVPCVFLAPHFHKAFNPEISDKLLKEPFLIERSNFDFAHERGLVLFNEEDTPVNTAENTVE